ncbi:hypothetical protein ACWZEH_29315 [Streptomyces sp. QTS137]
MTLAVRGDHAGRWSDGLGQLDGGVAEVETLWAPTSTSSIVNRPIADGPWVIWLTSCHSDR